MEINKSSMRANENISYSLFLEVILFRLRGETFKYSTNKKRNRQRKAELINEIAELEANNINDSNLENEKKIN